ncbi:GEVED domain-containing protein [Hymenobacter sp. B81]|uniref:GEVED domain-containing protein n=1 Tax=Hymenobacter sp. B81 TaxID=3344878 RepID=UPI0037DD724C
MPQLLPSRRWAPAFLLPLFSLLTAGAQAQCPATAATCTPGGAPAANYPFNMGIMNVTLSTLSNPTGGVRDGYQDYSCSLGTTLTIGQDYPLTVTTNTGADENVRVWLDLNNDGQFNPSTELLMSSSGRGNQTRTVRVPAGAVTGVALRLRIAADYVNAPVPTPCSTPQYSQTEDYRVTLQAASQPPVAAFVADQTLTCSGCVQFTDQSQNAPTSWAWTFGDGGSSSQQNPRHCYTAPGTYTVTLTATNAAGPHTVTRTNYIVYDNQVPVATSCAAPTVNFCCGYGITQLTLGSLTYNSANASAGYQDFTCNGRVSLVEGTPHNITIQTGNTNAQDTRAWLDLNNDGTFTSNELLLTALNRTSTFTSTLLIPATAVKNTPLRLRLITDFAGATVTPCGNVQFGQAEDYTVTVLPNTQPPVANFTSNYTSTCSNPVQFTDQSLNAPTSWEWDFGDGATSTQQNPVHTYTASGVYNVSLTARNAFGPNTVVKTAHVAVTVPCLTYCPSNGTTPNTWINTVTVSGGSLATPFTNVSTADGYGNFTNKVISLRQGESYTLSVASGTNFIRSTTAWIDYNRNGVFETTEIIANGQSNLFFNANFTIPGQVGVAGFTRMRVLSRLNNNVPNPCLTNQFNSETEDYSVNISPVLASREAQGRSALHVYPNPTADGLLRLSLTTAQPPATYALTVENALGAVVHRQSLRLLPGSPTELNLSALPRGLYVLRLLGADGQLLLRRVVRD